MKMPLVFHRIGVPAIRNPLPGFDGLYYRYWYRDIAKFGPGPLAHYLVHGWREGRDPSAGFSTAGYLAANPDVAALGINPLVHFLEHGFAEGRVGWQKNPGLPAPPAKLVDPPMKLLEGPRPTRAG